MKRFSSYHTVEWVLYLLLPMLAAAGLSSCHKDPNKTIFQGHITEYGTKAPIPGARIYLWCYNGEIFGPTGSSFIDSLVTDASGAFHTEYLDRDLCGGIYLSAFKEGFFYRSDIDIHSGVNDLEVVLDPEAWLKLVTIPDLGQWSHLGFGGTFSPHSVDAIKGIESQIFMGRGGREVVLHWGPSAGIVFSDSIYLVPHDTTVYSIHY